MSDQQSMISLLFVSPKTYSEMLRKLAGLTALEIYLMTALLRTVPEVSSAMTALESSLLPITNIKGFDLLKINASGVIFGFVAAFIFYHLQLHNKIEKIFSIRQRFDTEKIIFPLASLVGVSLSDAQRQKVRTDRHAVMRQVFYKYASSSGSTTLVDAHDIERALEAWTKFWAAEEAVVVLAVGAIVSALYASFGLTIVFSVLILFCVISMVKLNPTLNGRARAQIEQIAANAAAKAEVSQYLNAL